jgi:integrase
MEKADISVLVFQVQTCYAVLSEHSLYQRNLCLHNFMNFVEPIRDRKKIAQIKNLLRGEGRFRDLLLFTVGNNTALRVSDLLRLQINHFMDDRQNIKHRFQIKEQKRGKRHEVIINTSIREIFKEYLAAYPDIIRNPDHFIFFNAKINDFTEPIGRGQAWKIIVSICCAVGLRGNYGTHSLRKTWGYHARMQGVDLALIMQKLNHESIAYTKRYLGITDDELQAVVERLNL